MDAKDKKKVTSLSKSFSGERQVDWNEFKRRLHGTKEAKDTIKHGVEVIKAKSPASKPKTVAITPKKDENASPSDKKDAKDDKTKVAKRESSSSSGNYNGITVINIDKWTEHTRDEPRFIDKSERYLCGDMIGRGSQAQVFEALDTMTLKRLVVKKISKRKELGYEEDRQMQSILMECNILRRLDHPNIIKVIDVFLKSDRNYFELLIFKEYCACTVTEIMQSKPKKRLPIWQVHCYFTQLITGIDFLHSKRIIHHDIKPDNLLVNNDNRLKIIDFGISEEKDRYNKDFTSGSGHGTKLYFAPEKFFGLILGSDRYEGDKADLYAAGVCLHVLACGKHPYFDDDESMDAEKKLKRAIKKGVLQYSSVHDENPGMTHLIKWILTFHPKDRPTVEDVKHHPWFHLKVEYHDLADIPPRGKFGDKYRSMSMTSHLHQLHFPLTEEERAVVVRSESSAEIVARRKNVPYVKPNRLPSPNRSPPAADGAEPGQGESRSPPALWPQA